MPRRAALAAIFLCLRAAPAAAEAEAPARLGLGANVLGAQLDYHLNPRWRGELRYQAGEASSDAGSIDSSVVGVRAYRIFRERTSNRPYLGAELSYVNAFARGDSYRLSGAAGGFFGGFERRLSRRVWAGIDAGPYVFSIKEIDARERSVSLEFVANTFVMVYLF